MLYSVFTPHSFLTLTSTSQKLGSAFQAFIVWALNKCKNEETTVLSLHISEFQLDTTHTGTHTASPTTLLLRSKYCPLKSPLLVFWTLRVGSLRLITQCTKAPCEIKKDSRITYRVCGGLNSSFKGRKNCFSNWRLGADERTTIAIIVLSTVHGKGREALCQ